MQLTLHITKACNLRCRYCYFADFPGPTLSDEHALAAADLALHESPTPLALTWFGGEPLLAREAIERLTPEIRRRAQQAGRGFTVKMTTNGHRLDADFLAFCRRENVFISLSVDGRAEAHADRVDVRGQPAWDGTQRALELLESSGLPFAVYAVVTPRNAALLGDSVRFLRSYSDIVIVALDYDSPWSPTDFETLARSYASVAAFWESEVRAGRPFYCSAMDAKVESHTRADPLSRTCHAGVEQLSVAPDGTLFPCVQFVEHPEYAIGHANSGLDSARVAALFGRTHADGPCGGCSIRARCGRDCTCVRFQTSGDVHTLSDNVCQHERILTPIADAAARRLYDDRVPHFIQAHYNPAYHPLRAIESLLESS